MGEIKLGDTSLSTNFKFSAINMYYQLKNILNKYKYKMEWHTYVKTIAFYIQMKWVKNRLIL